jgi:hypothetical protein
LRDLFWKIFVACRDERETLGDGDVKGGVFRYALELEVVRY